MVENQYYKVGMTFHDMTFEYYSLIKIPQLDLML